jgi:hypothetical protein
VRTEMRTNLLISLVFYVVRRRAVLPLARMRAERLAVA